MTGPVSVAPGAPSGDESPEDLALTRLWRGFATARVGVAAVLLSLLAALFSVQQPSPDHRLSLAFCGAWLAAALLVRALRRPPKGHFDSHWVSTIGVDLLAISTLEYLQAGGMNFSPLFALPVLMAAVLGTRVLGFGTAACVTLLLLAESSQRTLSMPGDAAQGFLQAGLTGLGYFALAWLAGELSSRLRREEQRALQSQEIARIQAHVNELVIETLAAGILVVDATGRVRAANPTACALLGLPSTAPGFMLAEDRGWMPLLDLAQCTLEFQANQLSEMSVGRDGHEQHRVFVRTRIAGPDSTAAGGLCVVFMEDLREMEARLRTEKLAAMGRMSAAVAHEIRNPLAAIAQANGLLEEDLTDPAQRQLSALVRQNAERLARIVDEVLDVARAQQQGGTHSASVAFDEVVAQACQDWAQQTQQLRRLRVELQTPRDQVLFETDHLRRLLVNLLDNAARYAGNDADSVQVVTCMVGAQASLMVWSDGRPLEPAVQRHLFEPFFSSESRSSGLGLYICRELCERHGAQIGYRRCASPLGAQREGNEFFVNFRLAATGRMAGSPPPARISA